MFLSFTCGFINPNAGHSNHKEKLGDSLELPNLNGATLAEVLIAPAFDLQDAVPDGSLSKSVLATRLSLVLQLADLIFLEVPQLTSIDSRSNS